MNRSQKKCLIVSAALHGLLLGIALFGSAFLASKPKDDPQQVLIAFDPNLVNDLATKGGDRNVQSAPVEAPAPPPQAQQQTAITPPVHPLPQKPEIPKPPEPKVKPLPENDFEPVAKLKTSEEAAKPKKSKITLDPAETKLVKKATSKPVKATSEQDDNEAKQYAAAKKKLANEIGSSVRTLAATMSHRTTVDQLPGQGDGGPLSAAYKDVVASIYTAAWVPPAELDDDTATVTVKVTIARDGRVISGRIIKPSGNTGMDHSIQNVLENVTFIQPFPEGSRDQERTYNINFNLKTKRLMG